MSLWFSLSHGWDLLWLWAVERWAHVWVQNVVALAGFALFLGPVWLSMRSERWVRAWQRMRRDRMGMISGGIIALYLVIGGLEIMQINASRTVLDTFFSWVHEEKTYSSPLAGETLASKPEPLINPHRHLLGTDALGKDTFVQTLKATRTALIIGGLTSLIYIPIGVILGITAGYFRGWMDDLIQYTYSVVTSVPEILLLISLLLVLGRGLGTMSFSLAVTGWVGMCRLIRGETLRQAERPYVAAARSLGQGSWNIITHHLLPNVMHLVLINFILGFSGLVLAESILSYLGVGAPIGTASWGNNINLARSELSREPLIWWNIVSSTGALFLLVLALNLFGDALRKAFDPRRG